jgi:hypothetical protein
LLAEYSQWPFGKRAGGSAGVGANLGQVVSEEVVNAKDKELQLEVRIDSLHSFVDRGPQMLPQCFSLVVAFADTS